MVAVQEYTSLSLRLYNSFTISKHTNGIIVFSQQAAYREGHYRFLGNKVIS